MTMFGVLTIAVRIYQDRWGYGIYSGPIGSAVFIITVKWVSGKKMAMCISNIFQCFFYSISSSPSLFMISTWITSPLLLSNVLLCISSSFRLIHPFLVLFSFFAIPCTFLLRLLHFLFFLLCEVWCVNMIVMNSCCCSCRRWSSWGRFIRRRQCTRSRSVQAAASVLSL